MPRGQRHLVGGIDLPDGMHGRGAGRVVPSRAAARGGAAQPRLAQPAAQAAPGGQQRAGEMAGQDQPDQLGPPAGVFLAKGLRLQDEVVREAWPGGRLKIGRGGCLSVVVLRQPKQVVDGAEPEAELLGQGVGGKSPLMCGEKGATDGERNGAWHDRELPSRSSERERVAEH